MLDVLIGSRLLVVERFAWQSTDGSLRTPTVGAVHMRFDNGRGLHLDGASDWTLRWTITDSGEDVWMRPYLYESDGRWLLRDASREQPFVDFVGTPVKDATQIRDEVGHLVGIDLEFGGSHVALGLSKGEIDTSRW